MTSLTNEWEPEIRRFERQDRTSPPPADPLLFTGSSSIARWDTLATDFPQWPVLNRGFGGSEMKDLVHFADRLIFPLEPAGIVIYSGDNDLASGKRPTTVLRTTQKLTQMIKERLPACAITLLSVKLSPMRMPLKNEFLRLNRLFASLAQSMTGLEYLDVASCLLDDNGVPRDIYFAEDDLHLSGEGYREWTGRLLPHLLTIHGPGE